MGFSTGIQYVTGLYTAVVPQEKERKLPPVESSRQLSHLLYCRPVCKRENLLAQRYEINAGYPMPKATCMGGININFQLLHHNYGNNIYQALFIELQ